VGQGRHVHLILENDDNIASHLAGDFDAQWNDDGHHVLHLLLTGEHDGYYQDYADRPAERLARCMAEGFIYQGEPSPHRNGKPRGTRSAGLPPTAFVLFLQNHDQIGNRAFGDRLTILADPTALEAAIALQLLCPQIPLLFMGEEWASRTPFLFFTDHDEKLAQAVREGRRREFAGFSQFNHPRRLAELPDPNSPATFELSKPAADPARASIRMELYRQLLALRRAEIVPRLEAARSVDARAVGPSAVIARWQMGDGALLDIASNLGPSAAGIPEQHGRMLFASTQTAAFASRAGRIESYSTIAWLEDS
jgi:maltooligosyltrehalose trehalohydrolase